ncbi:MAG TPA: RICIN domain-containing protein [Terriglobales bacterium]
MSSPFFVQSKLGNLVIDIQGPAPSPGALLDAFTKKTSGPNWSNQLWQFVTSSFEGSYLLQNPATNLVIDIQGANTKPGTPLDAYTVKKDGPPPLDTNAPNQLWSFVPSSVTGYYFIQCYLDNTPLVIDVEGNSTKPGTNLDAYTQKTSPDCSNQFWTFVDEKGNSVTPPPPFTPPPPAK